MTGTVYGPDEIISREEAIRAYTATGAFLNREEGLKGSLEPGKFADMVVLSADILTVPEEQIMDIEVEQTYLHGELVYNGE